MRARVKIHFIEKMHRWNCSRRKITQRTSLRSPAHRFIAAIYLTQEAGRGTAGQHVTVCPRVPSAPVQTDRFIAAFCSSCPKNSDRQLIVSSRRSTITQEAGRGTAGQHVTVCPRVPSAPVQTDRFIAAFFLSSSVHLERVRRRFLSRPRTVLIGRFSRSIFSEIRFSSLATKWKSRRSVSGNAVNTTRYARESQAHPSRLSVQCVSTRFDQTAGRSRRARPRYPFRR